METDASDTLTGDNSNPAAPLLMGDTLTSTSPPGGMILPSNPDDTRCYCGNDRDLSVSELQCGMCLRFYHAQCLSCDIGPSVPFLINYQFFCKRCSSQESFTKRPATFSQMCHTAVANLCTQFPDQKLFSKDKDIIPFLEEKWEYLTTAARRVKSTWHNTLGKTMLKDVGIFTMHEDSSGDQFFGLVNQDLTKIGPNCESYLRLATGSYRPELKVPAPSEVKIEAPALPKSGRMSKRKVVDGMQSTIKNRKGELQGGTRLVPRGYPSEHPFNKDGYRYILAEPDPHAPNWQAFDESLEWAGKPIPGYLYRKYLEATVMMAVHDRAPQLKPSDDRMSVTGEKGYSMIRGAYGVRSGAWYFEITMTDMPDGTASRIGISQALGNLQAPCGYDKFSYAWRSRKGTRFHQSRGHHYCHMGYGQGDVIGVYVDLRNTEPSHVPKSSKDWPLVKFKSHLYYEEKDNVAEAEKKMVPRRGTKLVFYKNGENKGVAYEDLFEGTYYPAVSLYKSATVTMNFGPDFKHQPHDLAPSIWKPLSDAATDQVVENVMSDMLYHVDHEGKLPEF